MPLRNIENIGFTNIFDVATSLTATKGKLRFIEPQRAYMWEVRIDDPDLKDSGFFEDFSVYLMSAAVPSTTMDVQRRRYLGQEYYVTGQETSPKLFRMTVWDDDTQSARRYFQQWIDMVNDPMYNRSVGNKGRKDVKVLMKNNADTRISGVIDMTGCVPTGIEAMSLDYSDNSLATFEVSLTYLKKSLNPDSTGEQYRLDR